MEKRKLGRPPGKEYDALIHVRIPEDLRAMVDAARSSMPERPSLAVFVRQALAEAVRRANAEARGNGHDNRNSVAENSSPH